MALMHVSSPHAISKNDTANVMQMVLLATLPGIAALLVGFGWGVLTNIVFACLFGAAFEAIAIYMRKQSIGFYLKDYSAMVTAVLLAIALPPYSAWWIILVGMFFAIIIAKHLYGGIGYNPFNPAMIGYVVLLISFPVEMTRWATPLDLLPSTTSDIGAPNFFESFAIVIGSNDYLSIDGITMATPLDIMRQNNALMINDVKSSFSQFGHWGGVGWEWANIGFLLGGLFLLYKKIYTWHAPVSMLVALSLCAAIFYDGGSSNSNGSPLFHLLSGATMLGAWFIVTDPVSSTVSNKGRIIYGTLIGILIFIIRKWGNYPDAVAFAVLLMNFAAPLIDHYTQPKTYGH